LTLHIFTSQTLPSLDFQATLHAGRPNLPFYRSIQYLQDRTIFVCGPTAFEETVIQGLQGAGADSESILRENFAY